MKHRPHTVELGEGIMRRYVFLFCLSALLMLVLLITLSGRAAAEGTVTWSEPVNLSNSPTGSVYPAILADPYGYVHVFWTEDISGQPVRPSEELQKPGNTIMYRRWDGASWTDPVDVLAVPGDDVAEFISVDIDPAGRILATWSGQSNIYFSSAPAWDAGNVHAWTEPVAIAAENARSMRESAIAATPSGGIHVIYATRGTSPGVYDVSLNEDGTLQGAPVAISAPLSPLEVGYANVRLISDSEGHLHATWQSFQKDGYGQGVYYSQSLDDGANWSTPELLRYRESGDTWVEWPYLTAGRDRDLYLIYVDGTNKGRAFRVSRDGGSTWSKPKTILEELEGINGYVATLLDASGQVHLVGPMRTRSDQTNGIYHSVLSGDTFVPVAPVVIDGHAGTTSGAIHYMAATVRLGNELHLVWNEIRGSEIWYVKGTINSVDPAPARAVPTGSVPPVPAPVASEESTTRALATPTTQPALSAANPADRLPPDLAAPSGQAPATWTPIAAAVIPVLLLLTGVAVTQVRKR